MPSSQRRFCADRGFSEYGFRNHTRRVLRCWRIGLALRHEPAASLRAAQQSADGLYSASQLIQDIQRHGSQHLPVDIQHSQWQRTLEDIGKAQPAIRPRFTDDQRFEPAQWRTTGQRPAGKRLPLDRRASAAQPGASSRAVSARPVPMHWPHWQVRGEQPGWQVRGIDPGTGLIAGVLPADATPDLPGLSRRGHRGRLPRARADPSPHPLSLLRSRLTRQRLLSAAALRRQCHTPASPVAPASSPAANVPPAPAAWCS